mmetsp:Transcript_55589/g.131983  ORF Transcript_55589/g.131983 Transcript_55589/m.131983 type:complete len:201 (-) Transcript_55589:782-1384(-)
MRTVRVPLDERMVTAAAASLPKVTEIWSDAARDVEMRKLEMVTRKGAADEEGARHAEQESAMLSSKKVKVKEAVVGTGASAGCTDISASTSPAEAEGIESSKAERSPSWNTTRESDATDVEPSDAEMLAFAAAASSPVSGLCGTTGMLRSTTVSVPTPRSGAEFSLGLTPLRQRPLTRHVRPVWHPSHHRTASTSGCGTK